MLERDRAGGGPRIDAQFVEDVAEVSSNRVVADAELVRDLVVGLTQGYEGEHLSLAFRKPGDGASSGRGIIPQAREVGCGTQALEHCGRGIEVQSCRVGSEDLHARTRTGDEPTKRTYLSRVRTVALGRHQPAALQHNNDGFGRCRLVVPKGDREAISEYCCF